MGDFRPDDTRSGYFPAKADDDSSSESSEDEEDNEPEAVEAAVDEMAGSWQQHADDPWDLPGAAFYRHLTSRCIHVLQDEAGLEFLCGRPVTATYVALTSRPKFMHPTCNTCEKAATKARKAGAGP